VETTCPTDASAARKVATEVDPMAKRIARKRYWFITYASESRDTCRWHYVNDVLTEHPLEWLLRVTEEYDTVFRLIFYKEIRKAMYDKLKGIVG
jgi:hypothetical protein